MAYSIDNLTKMSSELQSNLELYKKLGEPIVVEYTKDLDEKIAKIRTYMNSCKEYNLDFDVVSLQQMCIDLSTTIYYTSANLEKIGLLEDLANIKFKDSYNTAYTTKQGAELQANRKYTAEQLRAIAEQEALEERLIQFIYSHSASIIKSKLESAQEVLKVISKSLSAEIQAMSTYQYSNKYNA